MDPEFSKFGATWGYILSAQGRPSAKRQRQEISLHGVIEQVWCDQFEGQTTRPRKHLIQREQLLVAVNQGDKVVVTAPECLGLSERDVNWFLTELATRGVLLLVHSGTIVVDPGGSTRDLAAVVGRFHSKLRL